MSSTRSIAATLVSLGALAAAATAQGAAPADGRALMQKVFDRSDWKDMQGDITLTLRNKAGQEKVREIKLWSRTNERDETSMLMRFDRPADVRGTGFLLIEHQGAEDDRRLFLPALRRVNRISAAGAGGNFMSSDFTYYDIGMPKLEDWTFSLGGDRTVAGLPCKVVTGTAASKQVTEDTGYAKVVWYVDPARLVIMGAEYYERGDRKIKTMEVLKVEDISGTPFATHMKVTDANSGHASEMVFANLKTDTGIEDKVFSERNLRKWTR